MRSPFEALCADIRMSIRTIRNGSACLVHAVTAWTKYQLQVFHRRAAATTVETNNLPTFPWIHYKIRTGLIHAYGSRLG